MYSAPPEGRGVAGKQTREAEDISNERKAINRYEEGRIDKKPNKQV
jgi:hypothetical protein